MGQTSSRAASPPNSRRRHRPLPWLRPPPTPDNTPPPPSNGPRERRPRPRPQSTVTFAPLPSEIEDEEPSSSLTPARRRSRLNRARNSLSASLPHMFARHGTSHLHRSFIASSPPHAFRDRGGSDDDDDPPRTPPVLQLPELDLSFDDLAPPDAPPRPRSRRQGLRFSSLSDRLSTLRPDRGLRNMTTSLRRRSPARRGEDQAAMLSRLLSVAAAATAASLMGGDRRAVAEARNVAPDGEDGTFDSFLQALQNGRIASALRQSGSEMEEGPDGSAAPLNFFRMFRFGSSDPANRGDDQVRSGSRAGRRSSRAPGNGDHNNNNSGEEDGSDGRMVPIIIVGIRSISPTHGNHQDEGNIPPFLDALSSIPAPPLTTRGDTDTESVLRQPRNGTSFSHRRRASMGGLNRFPSPYDSQRHHRSPDQARPWSTISDSPAGPRPPPSTPASPGLSTLSSGTSTPAPAPSSSSAGVQSTSPSRRASFVPRPTGATLEPPTDAPSPRQRTPRQRRMSESDFTPFGSGASRRNGVVEPDNSPGEGSRSWIIYVLGGSYPENHPILTTPSLFSDSPTYEDMLLLSALLGPAKPPVASEADVDASGGLFKIQERDGQVVASSMDGDESMAITVDERCLVCLYDFEVDEEARKLKKCGHLFHRECIDQWLLTGRNSCPLCRGQGVEEAQDPSRSGDNAAAGTPPVVA